LIAANAAAMTRRPGPLAADNPCLHSRDPLDC
jgi:hypothetical protein